MQDAKELADRGQHRLHQADIANTFARLARDENEASNVAIAATDAYRLSWCDGPPFAYDSGLAEAARHLEACGANPPDGLAAFDASKHEAMPDVDINPADEWYLDEEKYGTALIDGFGSEAPEPAE